MDQEQKILSALEALTRGMDHLNRVVLGERSDDGMGTSVALLKRDMTACREIVTRMEERMVTVLDKVALMLEEHTETVEGKRKEMRRDIEQLRNEVYAHIKELEEEKRHTKAAREKQNHAIIGALIAAAGGIVIAIIGAFT